jgi:hypothetical protein
MCPGSRFPRGRDSSAHRFGAGDEPAAAGLWTRLPLRGQATPVVASSDVVAGESVFLVVQGDSGRGPRRRSSSWGR